MTAASGRRAARVLLVSVLVATLLAACGLPSDKHPHEISDRAIADLAQPPTSATTPADPSGPQVRLYFVENEALIPLSVTVAGPRTALRRLSLLLKGPPSSADKHLTTSIPPRVRLRHVDQHGTTLLVDLSAPIKSIGGAALTTAYAQLTLTALDTEGVERVRFAVDGDAIDVPTDDGNLAEVSR